MTSFLDSHLEFSSADAADVDPVTVVARSVERLVRDSRGEKIASEFVENFERLYACEDFAGLFALLVSNEEVVFEKIRSASEETSLKNTERLAEGYFLVAIHLLEKIEEVKAMVDSVELFIEKIAKNCDKPGSRVILRLLMVLYNLFSRGADLKLKIAQAISNFAKDGELLRQLKACSVESDGEIQNHDSKWQSIREKVAKGSVMLSEISEELAVQAISEGAVKGRIDQIGNRLVIDAESFSPTINNTDIKRILESIRQ